MGIEDARPTFHNGIGRRTTHGHVIDATTA